MLRRQGNLGLAVAVFIFCLSLLAAGARAADHWSPPHRISEPRNANVDAPVVASNSQGFAAAAWYHFQPSGIAVQAAITGPHGSFRKPVTIGPAVLSIGGNPASFPSVAVDGRGNAIVTWLNKDVAGTIRVIASRRPRNGSFGPPQTVSEATGHSFQPKVTFDQGGNAHIVWQQFESGHFVVETAATSNRRTFGRPEAVSAAGVDSEFPQLGVRGHDQIIVVWRASVGTSNIVQAAFSNTRGGFAAPQTLSDPMLVATRPRLAVASKGEAAAVWSEGNNVLIGQVAVAFAGSRTTFGHEEVISPEQNEIPFNATVAIDGRGRATLLWFESAAPARTAPDLVRVAETGRRGMIASPQTLERTNEGIQDDALAVNEHGAAVAAWTTQTPHGAPISTAIRSRRATRFGPGGTLTPLGGRGFFSSLAAYGKGAIAVWVADSPEFKPVAINANTRRLH